MVGNRSDVSWFKAWACFGLYHLSQFEPWAWVGVIYMIGSVWESWRRR